MQLDLSRVIGVDCEWDDDEFIVACFAPQGADTFPVFDKATARSHLMEYEAQGYIIAAHNGRADYKTLGYYPASATRLDTLMLSWLIDENTPHGLKWLGRQLLGKDMDDPLIRRENHVYWRTTATRLKDADRNEVATYCAQDAETTRELALLLWPQVEKQDWYLNVEMPFDHQLSKMEQRGIRLDVENMGQAAYDLQKVVDEQRGKVLDLVGYEFNINSGQQVAKVLFTKEWDDQVRGQVGYYKRCDHKPDAYSCKLWPGHPKYKEELGAEVCTGPRSKQGWVPVKRQGFGLKPTRKTDGGLWSTDDEALEAFLLQPVVEELLKFREADKVLGTYLKSFPRFMRGDRLHGGFNSTGTKTGRLSSSEPNMQNIPSRGNLGKLVRGLFIPAEGCKLVIADLDQVELRLLAGMSKDPNLLHAFTLGQDVHQATGDLMSVDRGLAKNINYSMAYNASAKTIHRKYARNQTLQFVQDALATHERTFPLIYVWKEKVLEFTREHGFIYTLAYRKRRLPDIWNRFHGFRARAERQAINAVIQGSAADLFKLWMVKLYAHDAPMLLQVHDEVVLEVPEAETERWTAVLKETLQEAVQELRVTAVPITCEPKTVSTWAEAK